MQQCETDNHCPMQQFCDIGSESCRSCSSICQPIAKPDCPRFCPSKFYCYSKLATINLNHIICVLISAFLSTTLSDRPKTTSTTLFPVSMAESSQNYRTYALILIAVLALLVLCFIAVVIVLLRVFRKHSPEVRGTDEQERKLMDTTVVGLNPEMSGDHVPLNRFSEGETSFMSRPASQFKSSNFE